MLEKNKHKAKTFKEISDSIYNGAWNNLTLHKDSKKTFAVSAFIIGAGIIGAFILSKRK